MSRVTERESVPGLGPEQQIEQAREQKISSQRFPRSQYLTIKLALLT
jgi:hypothetical protein